MSVRSIRRLIVRAACAAAALLTGFSGLGAAQTASGELSGTLLKTRSTGVVTLAYREASVPFSYLSARGTPIGYSIDLCLKLVDAIGEAVGREVSVKWLPVTAESRIDAIASGKADLECGSTTNNLERQKLVKFSPVIFVSGTKLMTPVGSKLRSFRDLAGKSVVVTAGTTNEKTMRDIAKKFGLDFKLIVARDHAESFAMMTAGAADAFATDDVLLYGLISQNKARGKFDVVGEFLSYDPYGVMYRKGDPQMTDLVEATFSALADDGEIERQYRRWFLSRLPSGESIDLPMSAQLETIIRGMASKPE